MPATKCPLRDKRECPDHELFHYAANKISVEQAEHLMVIKDLEKRLQAAYSEIGLIMDAMCKLTGKPLRAKENKNELQNADTGSTPDVDAQRR